MESGPPCLQASQGPPGAETSAGLGWARLLGFGFGWLGFGWLLGFRLAFGFGFGLVWLDFHFWLSLTRILVGFDLVWLDFGRIWLDLGWIRVDFGLISA